MICCCNYTFVYDIFRSTFTFQRAFILFSTGAIFPLLDNRTECIGTGQRIECLGKGLVKADWLRFGKNRLHVCFNGMRFGSCCSWSFSCSRSSLTSSIAYQQVSCRNVAWKILRDGQNLSWLSKFSLYEAVDYIGCCF